MLQNENHIVTVVVELMQTFILLLTVLMLCPLAPSRRQLHSVLSCSQGSKWKEKKCRYGLRIEAAKAPRGVEYREGVSPSQAD